MAAPQNPLVQPQQPVPPQTPPPPPDWRKQAFDYLADSTKQMITVATGVVTITVLFSKDLQPDARKRALWAWGLLIISVTCGMFTLFNLTGAMYEAAVSGKPPKLQGWDIRGFSVVQILAFLAGIIAVVVFGFHAVRDQPQPEPKPLTVNCVIQQPAPPPPNEATQKPQDGAKKHPRKQVKKKKAAAR